MNIKKGADILLQLKDFLSRFKILLQRKVVKTSKSPLLEEVEFNKNEKITSHPLKPDPIDNIVNTYHQLRTIDKRPMEDVIQYDKLGLPK
jgi:hypothetical protein